MPISGIIFCTFPLKIQKKSCKKLVINQGNGYKVGSKARKKLSPNEWWILVY